MSLNQISLSYPHHSSCSFRGQPVLATDERILFQSTSINLTLEPILRISQSQSPDTFAPPDGYEASSMFSFPSDPTPTRVEPEARLRVANGICTAKGYFSKGGTIILTNTRLIYLDPSTGNAQSAAHFTSDSGLSSNPGIASRGSCLVRSGSVTGEENKAREQGLRTFETSLGNILKGQVANPLLGKTQYRAEIAPIRGSGVLAEDLNYELTLWFHKSSTPMSSRSSLLSSSPSFSSICSPSSTPTTKIKQFHQAVESARKSYAQIQTCAHQDPTQPPSLLHGSENHRPVLCETFMTVIFHLAAVRKSKMLPKFLPTMSDVF